MQLKEFWAQNGKSVIRLYLNQIVMSVFGLMVVTGAGANGNPQLLFLASVLAVGLYLFLIYSLMWEAGAKAAAKTLRAEDAEVRKIQTPLLIVFFGSIFNLALYFIYTVLNIYVSSNNITDINNGAAAYGNLFELIIKMTNAIYIGFADLLFPNPNFDYELLTYREEQIDLIMHIPPYYFFLTLLPLIITGIGAYYLGASEISLLQKLGLKPSKNKK